MSISMIIQAHPLVNIQKTMENHHFSWVNHKSTIDHPFSIVFCMFTRGIQRVSMFFSQFSMLFFSPSQAGPQRSGSQRPAWTWIHIHHEPRGNKTTYYIYICIVSIYCRILLLIIIICLVINEHHFFYSHTIVINRKMPGWSSSYGEFACDPMAFWHRCSDFWSSERKHVAPGQKSSCVICGTLLVSGLDIDFK